MPFFPVTYPDDKPGAGLEAPAAGHRLEQRDGVWVVDADDPAAAAACQAWLDAYDDLTAQREGAKLRVKDEAKTRIYTTAPDTVQRNSLARCDELLLGMITGGLSADDRAELQAIHDLWTAIKGLRAASNLIEADVDGMTAQEAHEFDPAASPRWPA